MLNRLLIIAVAYLAGVLLAPRSGKETREIIKRELSKRSK